MYWTPTGNGRVLATDPNDELNASAPEAKSRSPQSPHPGLLLRAGIRPAQSRLQVSQKTLVLPHVISTHTHNDSMSSQL